MSKRDYEEAFKEMILDKMGKYDGEEKVSEEDVKNNMRLIEFCIDYWTLYELMICLRDAGKFEDRIKELGKEIYQCGKETGGGGKETMQAAYMALDVFSGEEHTYELLSLWSGIGNWDD